MLSDPAAERGVLAAICQGGGVVLAEAQPFIRQPDFFTVPSNQILWRVLVHLLGENPRGQVDIASLYSAARALGVEEWMNRAQEVDHLRAILRTHVEPGNLRRLSARVARLAVTRQLRGRLEQVQERLEQITGDETLASIRSLAEGAIFDFDQDLVGNQEGPVRGGDRIEAHVEELLHAPEGPRGLSIGYPNFEKAIGGGPRRKSVSLVAARAKAGKAQWVGSTVWTPAGPVLMGCVQVGDWVCGPRGDTRKVLSVHPQGEIQLYQVECADGARTTACWDHLWLARHPDCEHFQIFTTRQLAQECEQGWEIPLAMRIRFDPQPVPLDPFTLGVFLARGTLRGEQAWIVATDPISTHLEGCTPGALGALRASLLTSQALRTLLDHSRSIPACYRHNTRRRRLALLQGILTGQTEVGPGGVLFWFTPYSGLAQGVQEVMESLGGTVSRVRVNHHGWRLTLHHPRPHELFLEGGVPPDLPREVVVRRKIIRIQRWRKAPAVCLKLSAPDGLYLTDHFLVTHNTFLGDNAALHVGQKGIPALVADTEMSLEDHHNRQLAYFSGVDLTEIEERTFRQDPAKLAAVLEARDQLRKIPYHYVNVSGMGWEEISAYIRRWILAEVGLGEDDRTNPCLVVYDYVKMMDAGFASQHLSETQAVGFLMTQLHNLAVRHDVPVLTFCQVNREGITDEEISVLATSDRYSWFASNVSLLKQKSPEDVAQELERLGEGATAYTLKLVPLITRYGKGVEKGDYINLLDRRQVGKIEEGPTRNQLFFGRGRGPQATPRPGARPPRPVPQPHPEAPRGEYRFGNNRGNAPAG